MPIAGGHALSLNAAADRLAMHGVPVVSDFGLPPCLPHRLSHCVPLTVSPTLPLSPSLPLCLPHRLSHCVSLTVSPTLPLSPSLPLCLPHRLSPTASPSPSLSLCSQVVPAGNNGGNTAAFSPSGAKGAICIGATDQNDLKTDFSNSGPLVGSASAPPTAMRKKRIVMLRFWHGATEKSPRTRDNCSRRTCNPGYGLQSC
jgi:hypothetical protein